MSRIFNVAFHGLPFFIAGGFLAATMMIPWLWPMSYWYELKTVHINDYEAGTPGEMLVVGKVTRPFYGTRTVTIARFGGQRWEMHCVARNEYQFRPLNKLPQPLTLKWWTWGQCHPLPPGQYQLSTTVQIFEGQALFEKTISIESNIFTVHDHPWAGGPGNE